MFGFSLTPVVLEPFSRFEAAGCSVSEECALPDGHHPDRPPPHCPPVGEGGPHQDADNGTGESKSVRLSGCSL